MVVWGGGGVWFFLLGGGGGWECVFFLVFFFLIRSKVAKHQIFDTAFVKILNVISDISNNE